MLQKFQFSVHAAASPARNLALACAISLPGFCQAQAPNPTAALSEPWSVHGQSTFVYQGYPTYHAAFSGSNSLAPNSQAKETVDATLFLSVRLLDNLALYANPEIDQGYGLSNTVGAAGFTSAEAYKVGKYHPYYRMSANNGNKETYEFSDINRSVSAGLSEKGTSWGRQDDVVGLAGAANGISPAARRYFAAGGLGVLVGDGALPRYGSEKILEVYYSWHLLEWATLSVDYQYVDNPAYNPLRGPISVFAIRGHVEL